VCTPQRAGHGQQLLVKQHKIMQAFFAKVKAEMNAQASLFQLQLW